MSKEEEIALLRERVAEHMYNENYNVARQYLYLIEEVSRGSEENDLPVVGLR